MNLKLTRHLIVILISSVILGISAFTIQQRANRPVQAVGDLVATFPSAPLFSVSGLLPGDTEIRTFTVQNTGLDPLIVWVRTDNEISTPASPDLAAVLDITIQQVGGSYLYGTGSPTGPKKLADLYAEPMISLGLIGPGQTLEYQIELTFPTSTDNQYQSTATIFDIVIIQETTQPPIDLPAECSHLAGIITEVIEGTPDNDRIRGTSASELILGFAGDDRITGGGGHDCLVGGEGNDNLNAGTGNDVLLGQQGNDLLDGHSDNDRIYGGPGNDILRGKAGDDLIYGGEGDDRIDSADGQDTVYGQDGNDIIDGGSLDDTIYGGAGNDRIKGASGNDTIDGQAGDDIIRGNSGDDRLIGGTDTDRLDGDSGFDTCSDGPTYTSCEIIL